MRSRRHRPRRWTCGPSDWTCCGFRSAVGAWTSGGLHDAGQLVVVHLGVHLGT